MPGKAKERREYRVLVSHDGLNEGEIFGVESDGFGWAQTRVDAGYLERLDQEGASDARESDVGQG